MNIGKWTLRKKLGIVLVIAAVIIYFLYGNKGIYYAFATSVVIYFIISMILGRRL